MQATWLYRCFGQLLEVAIVMQLQFGQHCRNDRLQGRYGVSSGATPRHLPLYLADVQFQRGLSHVNAGERPIV